MINNLLIAVHTFSNHMFDIIIEQKTWFKNCIQSNYMQKLNYPETITQKM